MPGIPGGYSQLETKTLITQIYLLCVLEFTGQRAWSCDVPEQEKECAHSKRANQPLFTSQALCWLDRPTHVEFSTHPIDSQKPSITGSLDGPSFTQTPNIGLTYTLNNSEAS